ncbi:MAG: Mur ligase family protein, partial [Clostridiaceae bacterium]
MKLKEMLKNMDYEIIKGNDDIDINKIEYDSRKIGEGDLFVCIDGFKVDGHKYAESACNKGAVAIVCSKNLEKYPECTIIKVKDGRKTLAISASNFYDNPANKLKLIGVTGTNGKTTSTFMIKSILEQAGYNVGLVGTIANFVGSEKIKAERTTPESLELQQLFKNMVDKKIDYCVMEVSSHSLSLDRVCGINFSQAIFTNLTQDHLDFH